jgi:phosphosulfolactate phosphohydrolase-like enzyme
LLNLKSTAERIRSHRGHRTLLVCGGTYEEAAYEDIIGAGGICSLLWDDYPAQARSDSALAAYTVYMAERGDLPAALGKSRNGQRLLTIPELREDPAWCARLNTCDFACVLEEDGCIRRR